MLIPRMPWPVYKIFCLVLLAFPAWAIRYEPSVEQSQWLNEGNIFGCRLYQPIGNFGLAVFRHRAGETPEFILETARPIMAQTQARLNIEAPSWRANALASPLGTVTVAPPPMPIVVDSQRTYRLLAELEQGMAPAVTAPARHGEGEVHVRVSPKGFVDNMGTFHACQALLLPVNFDQIERSTIYFAFNSLSLNDADSQLLADIATYVQADPAITGLFIDGHSDRFGSRYDNRRVSEDRASLVTDRLIAEGVPAELILTRYHGERYPISDDPDENRRVTIRLERVPNAPFEP